MASPLPQRVSRAARSILHNMPPLIPRESMRATSVIPALIQRPSPSDERVGFSIRVTRLRLGSLALRPAALPLGNLRPPITRTPLPSAKKAYGQLLSRDFNPLDIPPITANGLSPDLRMRICRMCATPCYQ
ncbi:hypothetical protein ACCAA_480001 [Candidatus Accumulibacter aalborgensis]|uniref:Uncharacterized protein n=1 Tax=Candidatus Accumulibacter aalborgensis TaxID=1860102 RepID=A0A1A8XUL0_9PROT|nr:hypothetical protein ACCAA_480001 [Candidatus Accumulibacter aalborgensis]